MRKSLLSSLVLGCGALLGLVSFSANATPIHPGIQVNLSPAGGSTTWTSPPIGDPHGTVSLSGWEYDKYGTSYAWTPATMYDKNLGYAAEQGLGVLCNQSPYHNECGQKEIGSTPWQMIDVNISALHDWSGLSLSLGSVNGNQFPVGGDETGYLLGASCQVGGTCTPITIGSCSNFGGPGKPATCSFSFTKTYLLGLGITDIWVTPSLTNQSTKNNGNILLGGTLTLFVPEPATLGMFGLGVLLIGLLTGLRRRKTD